MVASSSSSKLPSGGLDHIRSSPSAPDGFFARYTGELAGSVTASVVGEVVSDSDIDWLDFPLALDLTRAGRLSVQWERLCCACARRKRDIRAPARALTNFDTRLECTRCMASTAQAPASSASGCATRNASRRDSPSKGFPMLRFGLPIWPQSVAMT